MQTEKYALEWLDDIINITLNPANNVLSLLTGEQIAAVAERAIKETYAQKSFLKRSTFLLAGTQKMERIDQYRDSLVLLLDQAYENRSNIDISQTELLDACQSIIWCISNILSFVQEYLGGHGTADQRVPSAHLKELKNNIRFRAEILRLGLLANIGSRLLADIITHTFERFTREFQNRPITAREVNYKLNLLEGIEKIDTSEDETLNHGELIKTLVYLNFNSRAFTNYYTRRVADIVNVQDQVNEKIARLLLEHKVFNQMLRKPGIILNPGFDDLNKVITNWFIQELDYLDKKNQSQISPLQADTSPSDKLRPFKVLCFLSVDQMALIFRCMDALRIFQAKSLSMVIKSIAPFLSTPHKQHISWENMRSKSYAIEEGDRQAVLKTLESMIKWIKEYET